MSGEQDRSPDEAVDLARAKAFLAQIEPRFTYAASLQEHPHEYVARVWLSVEQQ